jgi:hypothetical protein
MVSIVRSPKTPPPVPPAHVIAVYTHRVQQVTCTCGWQGSSAPRPYASRPLDPRPGGSDWSDHVAAHRQQAAGADTGKRPR